MKSRAAVLLAVCTMTSLPAARSYASGLVITPTFDATITGDPNAAQIIAGINAAIARVDSAIASNVAVNITFQSANTGLGASSTFFSTLPYSTYRADLSTKQTVSGNDTTAIGSLPALLPAEFSTTNGNVQVSLALLRAWGLTGAPVGPDSTITLNTSLMYFDRSSPVGGKFDLQAVAAHEIDEALGIGGFGSTLPSTTGRIGALDLFRYSAAGTRSFTSAAGKRLFLH